MNLLTSSLSQICQNLLTIERNTFSETAPPMNRARASRRPFGPKRELVVVRKLWAITWATTQFRTAQITKKLALKFLYYSSFKLLYFLVSASSSFPESPSGLLPQLTSWILVIENIEKTFTYVGPKNKIATIPFRNTNDFTFWRLRIYGIV